MVALSAFDLTPARSCGMEWVLSNGLGGFSSSTAIGMNSRKYHGLLIAPIKSGADRRVLVNKMEETARVGAKEYPLSTNSYPGTIYPEGYRHMVGFEYSGHPVFAYSLDGAKLAKSVRMPHGKNAVVVSYRLLSGKDAELAVRPLLAPRKIHADPSAAPPALECRAERHGFVFDKPTGVGIFASAGKFISEPLRYSNMEYRVERDRGYPFTETLYSPGYFAATLTKQEELHIVCSMEMMAPHEALECLDRDDGRAAHIANSYAMACHLERTDFSDALVSAADSFVFVNGKRAGIIAGYHWFSEWGRDSMIALPGIAICTGRTGLAREILQRHAERMKEGLLPNFIDEEGRPHYNSADASLWLVNAVREYYEATHDRGFVQNVMMRHLRAIVEGYEEGNEVAGLDSDGLLEVKDPSSTWMDARVGGKAVTPRSGKPVEINALWHSGLHFVREAAGFSSDRRLQERCTGLIGRSSESFHKFLSADEGYLFDVIEPADASLRPNMIFAVGLPHSPLNEIQKKHVFNIVRSRLYTPYGLHTLAPDDPRFAASYQGSQERRDAAYHQGMVWPWLLGAFYDAQLSVYPESARQVLFALKPFYEAMKKGCVGSLPEMYEPDSMAPCGAVSQAWSVAEVLRIYTKVKKMAQQKTDEPQARQNMQIREA